MSAGFAAALAATFFLLAAAWMFAAGLRQAVRAACLAHRQRRAKRPLRLVVAARRDHGAYVQIDLRRIGIAGLSPLPAFEPGMYVSLQVPAGPTNRASRRYSLAGWQRRPRCYQLAIKREPGGLVSNWVADHLQVGAFVEVLRPAGHFVLPRRFNGEVVLIGAGIGITPLRSMLQAWVRSDRRHPVTLVWSVRHPTELMDYDAEFRALALRRAAFRYVPVLTGDATVWHGERGRISAARLLSWTQSRAPHGFWMCASAPMMDALRAGLVATGVADNRIHQEAFAAAANDDTARYKVLLSPSGRELSFCGEPSLLALMQAEGEPIASDCRNGTCGACRLTLRSGAIRQVIVPEWPVPERELLACCSVPASDLVLETAGISDP
jgi:hypothetical protein